MTGRAEKLVRVRSNLGSRQRSEDHSQTARRLTFMLEGGSFRNRPVWRLSYLENSMGSSSRQGMRQGRPCS